jgi:transcription initiation factor TFIIIB Brf1 subunit/transcription initiation factor TFIIB
MECAIDIDNYFSQMGMVNERTVSKQIDNGKCPQCSSETIGTLSDGTQSCSDCGINLGDVINYNAEWRYDPEGVDQSRCGMPVDERFIESSYSMGISSTGKKGKIYDDIQRILNWNGVHNKEKSMKNRFSNIEDSCKMFGVSLAIIKYAQDIYYDIYNALMEDINYSDYRADNNKGLQAAAVFYAFQEDGHPKTCKEVSYMFGINTKHISEGLKVFNDLMKNKYKRINNQYSDYMDDYCNKVHLDDATKARVREVADTANKLQILDDKTPTSIVAGCIYYVVMENAISNLKKSVLSKKLSVSAPTITKVCDILLQYTIELC